MRTSDARIARLEDTMQEHSHTFSGLREDVTHLTLQVGHLGERLNVVDQRLDRVDQRLERFEDRTDRRFDAVDQRLHRLDDKMSRLFVVLVGLQATTLLAVVGVLVARA